MLQSKCRPGLPRLFFLLWTPPYPMSLWTSQSLLWVHPLPPPPPLWTFPSLLLAVPPSPTTLDHPLLAVWRSNMLGCIGNIVVLKSQLGWVVRLDGCRPCTYHTRTHSAPLVTCQSSCILQTYLSPSQFYELLYSSLYIIFIPLLDFFAPVPTPVS